MKRAFNRLQRQGGHSGVPAGTFFRGLVGWLIWPFLMLCLVAGRVCAEVALPPWYTDNMILQRPAPPSTKPADVLIWGWMEEGESVTVSFGEKARPIAARTFSKQKKWEISYEQVGDRLPQTGPFSILIESKKGKKKAVLTLSNVQAGDVWVLGQRPTNGVPLSDKALRAVEEAVKDKFRYTVADSLNWVDEPSTLRSVWKDWEAGNRSTNSLSNVACLFARNLLKDTPDIPVGLIALPANIFFYETALKEEPAGAVPSFKPALDAAMQAAQEAEREYLDVLGRYEWEIRQRKREGKTLDPPASPIETRLHLHKGGLPKLPCAVRGVIW